MPSKSTIRNIEILQNLSRGAKGDVSDRVNQVDLTRPPCHSSPVTKSWKESCGASGNLLLMPFMCIIYLLVVECPMLFLSASTN